MINKKNTVKESRKGFTLVETIVVMLLVAMLSAASVGGMIAWRHNAEFRKANEYAKTLFTAAQSYLTMAKANGNLDDLKQLFESGSASTQLVPSAVAGDKSSYLHYLVWTPADYETLSNDGELDKYADAFYEMFRKYLYDKSILDASVCVEFDPADGVVSAVLYSTHTETLSYSDSNTNGNLRLREEAERREILLGLYDTETGNRSPGASDAPRLSTVELVNGDTLDLRFRLKDTSQTGSLVYEIELQDANGRTIAAFQLNASDAVYTNEDGGAESNLIPAQSSTAVQEQYAYTKITRYTYDEEEGKNTPTSSIDNCKLRAYVTSDNMVYVTLDAADLAAADILENTDELSALDKDAFNNTYSILRLGENNIYSFFSDSTGETDKNNQMGTISAKVRAKGYKTGNWKLSNSESPLISVPTRKLAEKKYNIANARHLFNLRFMEAGFEENGYNDEGENEITYYISSDFSWAGEGGILDSDKVFSDGQVVAVNRDTIYTPGSDPIFTDVFYDEDEMEDNAEALEDASSELLQACSFPALPGLAERHTIDGTSASGRKTISDLYIVPGMSEDGTQNSGQNTDIENSSGSQQPLGLFRENEGTIENVILENLHVIGTWDAAAEETDPAASGISETDAKDPGTDTETPGTTDTITGIDCVGGVCGTNNGILSNVYVNGGRITGHNYVGGLIGKNTNSEEDVTLSELKNSAAVLGNAYVGGIISSIENELDPDTGEPVHKIEITNCENQGEVRCQEALSADIEDGKSVGTAEPSQEVSCGFIGGIAGYNRGGEITDCKSTLSLDIDIDTAEVEDVEPLFAGTCVGGVVGYNDEGGIIKWCSTGGGTVVGDSYVGGIIGFNNAVADSEQEAVVDGTNQNNGSCENKANVIGNRFVGGIVGINAQIETNKETGEQEISMEYVATNKVRNWINRGMVVAREEYGGGITGFNTGDIIDCDCVIDISATKGTTLLERLEKWSRISTSEDPEQINGKYIGGLAGYNNGRIYNNDKNASREIVSVVAGDNYVGGIVGYNDVNGDIENYNLQSGYISGNAYVGGFAGLNTSPNIFLSHDGAGEASYAVARPNIIKGNYFVGGMVGGNFMVLDKNITIDCDTDNFLGNIGIRDEAEGGSDTEPTAGIFMGGLIGYNGNLDSNAFQGEKTSEAIFGIISDIADNMRKELEGDSDEGSLSERIAKANEIIAGYISAEHTITVSGAKLSDASADRKNELNQIEGSVYVGGTMGYNHEDSAVIFRNITNKIPVIADANITDSSRRYDVQPGEGQADGEQSGTAQKRYSYAGGIIGIATRNTTIDNCKNDGTGRVTAPASTTYHGALVEVNEGTIINCQAASTGEYGLNYVGGIAGVNGYTVADIEEAANALSRVVQGTIRDCSVTGTIIGTANVGGITAENYGIIENITFAEGCLINGSGENVGGITGDNIHRTVVDGTDALTVTGSITEVTMENLKITGTGTYVGGIAGSNSGIVGSSGTAQAASDGFSDAGAGSSADGSGIVSDPSVNIQGNANVGGFIGRVYASGASEGESSTGDGDFSSDTGVPDDAAAAAVNFINYGTVNALQGAAGGIVGTVVSEEKYQITNCVNYGTVQSQRSGNAGGISGNNATNGYIYKCKDYGQVSAGQGNTGGIVAVNNGTVLQCEVAGKESTLLTLESRVDIGGIASENTGTISQCTLSDVRVTNQALSSSGNIGGAVGSNAGTVSEVSIENAEVLTYTADSNVGGIAGQNTAQGVLDGAVEAPDGQTTGKTQVKEVKVGFAASNIHANLGGIVGANSGIVENYAYIAEAGTKIEGNGGASNGYGGIAGINGYDGKNSASIKNCEFKGTISAKGTQSVIASVGGIVGINKANADITGADISDGSKITADNAYIGGAVGRNYGKVSGINSAKLTDQEEYASYGEVKVAEATVLVQSAMGQIGGLIGQNEDGASLSDSSTGEGWFVNATSHATDNAIGGAVGYNYSSKAMSNVQNLAYVMKKTGNSVSGLVGRWENSKGDFILIQDCVNRGRVEGAARVGGIVGQWKYSNGTVRRCRNYGTIILQSTSSEHGGAGIIAYFYEIESSAEIQIIDCSNFGDIRREMGTYGGTRYLAGIAGCCNYTSTGNVSPEFYFENCVNAGDIYTAYDTDKCAGINANVNKANVDMNASFVYCRNYGRGYCKNSYKSDFCGISCKPGNLTLQNCYGVAAPADEDGDCVFHPLVASSNAASITGSYYFGREAKEIKDEDKEYIISGTVTDKDGKDITNVISEESNIKYYFKNAFDGKEDTRYLHKYASGIKAEVPLLTLETDTKQVNELEIIWFCNGYTRTYKYELGYVDTLGETHWKTEPLSYDCLATGGTQKGSNIITDLGFTNVKQILIRVLSVTQNNSQNQYLSIWEIKINGKTNPGSDSAEPDVDKTELLLTQVPENNWTAWNEVTGIRIPNLPYDPNGVNPNAGSDDISIKDYEAIDPYLLKSYSIGNLDTPQNVNVEVDLSEAFCKVNWKEYGDAQLIEDVFTEVVMTIKDADGNVIKTLSKVSDKGSTELEIEIPEDYIDQGYAAAISVQHKIEDHLEYGDSPLYVWKPDISLDLKTTLPTPKVHLELVSLAGSKEMYRCVWENAADYEDGAALSAYFNSRNAFVTITKDQDNVDEETGTASVIASSTPASANSGRFNATVTKGNNKSDTISYQTMILPLKTLNETAQASGVSSAYYGLTPEATYSIMKLKGTNEQFYRAELMAYDEALGADVAVSSTTGRVPQGITVDMSLMNLPQDYNYDTVDNILSPDMTGSGSSLTDKNMADDDLDTSWTGGRSDGTAFTADTPGTLEFLYHEVQSLDSLEIDWGYTDGTETTYTFKLGYRGDTGDTVYPAASDTEWTFTANAENQGRCTLKNLGGVPAADLVLTITGVSQNGTAAGTVTIREVITNGQANISPKKFTGVRAYLWRSQNDIVYYAQEVASGLTAAEVKAQYFEADKFKEGYSAEKTEDGLYTIIYNACEETQQMIENKQQISIAAPPAISPSCTQNDDGTYTFTWDESLTTTNTYEVILTGYTERGGEGVVVSHTKDQTGRSLTVSSENWKYKYLELKVIKYGTVKTANNVTVTTVLGSQSTQGYSIKLPLSTVTAPNIRFDADTGKDELIYNISWSGLQDEEELQNLEKYVIYAKHVTESGVSDSGPIVLGEELYDENCDSTIQVDFDKIQGISQGELLQIYVKAIAKADSVNYTDSANGVSTSFTVPVRISTPSTEDMSLTMENGDSLKAEDGTLCTVSSTEFTDSGFLYTISSQPENSTSIFQAYLCSSIGTGEIGTNEDGSPALTDGAELIPVENSNSTPVSMGGSTYNFTGISTDYAGYYLILRARTTSDNQISSLWSAYTAFQLPKVRAATPELGEETAEVVRDVTYTDTATGQTQTQAATVTHDVLTWYAVPYAEDYQVDVMRLLETETDAAGSLISQDMANEYSVYIRMRTDGVWGYEVGIGRGEDIYWNSLAEDTNKEITQYYPDSLSACSYEFEQYEMQIAGTEENKIYPGYEFTLNGTTQNDTVNYTFKYYTAMQLQVILFKDGRTLFRLILPDSAALNTNFQRTQYVTVQAVPRDEDGYYSPSLYRQWIRTQNITDRRICGAALRELADKTNSWENTDQLNLDTNWQIQRTWFDWVESTNTMSLLGDSLPQDSSEGIIQSAEPQENTVSEETPYEPAPDGASAFTDEGFGSGTEEITEGADYGTFED